MKIFFFIILSLIFFSCTSPDEVSSTIDKDIIDDPNLRDPHIRFDPKTLVIENVHPNSLDSNKVTIYNISNESYQLNQIDFMQGINFLHSDNLPDYLEPQGVTNNSHEFQITFAPNESGYHYDTLKVNNERNQRLYIEGQSPYVYADDITFDDTPAGVKVGAILRIYNNSSDNVLINDIYFEDDSFFSFFSDYDLPIEINANEVEILNMQFEPNDVGEFETKLFLKTDFNELKDEEVTLKGRGIN